jgi:hypothetical protein
VGHPAVVACGAFTVAQALPPSIFPVSATPISDGSLLTVWYRSLIGADCVQGENTPRSGKKPQVPPLRSRKTPQLLEDPSRMLDLTEVKLR